MGGRSIWGCGWSMRNAWRGSVKTVEDRNLHLHEPDLNGIAAAFPSVSVCERCRAGAQKRSNSSVSLRRVRGRVRHTGPRADESAAVGSRKTPGTVQIQERDCEL